LLETSGETTTVHHFLTFPLVLLRQHG
jgi:hypothetical protein